jgi:hypothetical protein
MKKVLALTLIVSIFSLAALVSSAVAQEAMTFTFVPAYPIMGSVNDADGVAADGHKVVFYKNEAEYFSGIYTLDYVGPTGTATSSNTFLVNAANDRLFLEVGETYKVAVVQDEAGYGAGPVDVLITGKGYEIVEIMTMALGAGVPDATVEPPCSIRIWFGTRLYQPAVYNESNPFVISETPKIEAKIGIAEPYSVSSDPNHYSIIVDEGIPFVITGSNMVAKTMAAGDAIRSFTLEYAMTEDQKLDSGKHVFMVSAQSSGVMGTSAAATQIATVEVMGGPLRLIGTPVVFPSPFSQRRDGTCTIQYGLSQASNIEIYIYSVSGQVVKKFMSTSGTEGGNAGINKITWDGRTEMGLLAGNAVYVGTIISRDDKRLLGKFKFSIVD